MKIIFHILHPNYETPPTELSEVQIGVLKQLGKYTPPLIVRYKRKISQFDIKDVFWSEPLKLTIDGIEHDTTYVQFYNGQYAYIDLRYSDYLRVVKTMEERDSRKKVRMTKMEEKEVEIVVKESVTVRDDDSNDFLNMTKNMPPAL